MRCAEWVRMALSPPARWSYNSLRGRGSSANPPPLRDLHVLPRDGGPDRGISRGAVRSLLPRRR